MGGGLGGEGEVGLEEVEGVGLGEELVVVGLFLFEGEHWSVTKMEGIYVVF